MHEKDNCNNIKTTKNSKHAFVLIQQLCRCSNIKLIKTPQLEIVVVCAKLYRRQNYGAIWFILTQASSQHIPGPKRFFSGGTRQGCSVCNIICRFLWCVTVPVLQRTRSQDNPPTPNWGSLGHARVRQRRGVSRKGKYMFSIP